MKAARVEQEPRVTLSVYMPQTSGSAFDGALRVALDDAVDLAVGAERPQPARYRVLVAGRPTPEDLDASEALGTLVIPFAGLPPTTRTALLERPKIAVHNLHHNAPATAEMAVGLLLAAARRIVPADRGLRQGDWRIRYDTEQGIRLVGRRALVVGYGAIGRRVARVLRALDMDVVAVRRQTGGGAEDGIEVCSAQSLDDHLPQAEVVVLAVPATAATRGLLDERRLAALPRGAVLVNVARGDVVDEGALYEALLDGQVGAAGLDVWWRYPADMEARSDTLPSTRPFHELDNVVLSPHRAGHGAGTERERARHLAAILTRAARGHALPDRVDLERGY